MKRPSLLYNYYYPFYTLSESGKKKYLHYSHCTMHISDERVLQITTKREKGKTNEVVCEFIKDKSRIYKTRTKDKLVHYNVFSDHVKSFYNAFSKALRTLNNEPCYWKTLVFSSLVKFNEDCEIEIEYNKLSLKINPVDYRVENGKIVRLKESPFANSDTEAGKKWEAIGKAFDDKTSFQVVEKDKFESRLEYIWNDFFPYFDAPKFIKKSQYIPK